MSTAPASEIVDAYKAKTGNPCMILGDMKNKYMMARKQISTIRKNMAVWQKKDPAGTELSSIMVQRNMAMLKDMTRHQNLAMRQNLVLQKYMALILDDSAVFVAFKEKKNEPTLSSRSPKNEEKVKK